MTLPHKAAQEAALEMLNSWHEKYMPNDEPLFDKTTMPPINLYNIGPSHMKTTRSEILTEADKIVNGARADQYGGPEDSFQKIASLWTAYLSSMDEEVNISASDVACMMTLLKIARLCNSPDHRDSWVDVAGYAACGAEVAKPSYRDMFASSQAPDAGQQYVKEQMQSSFSDECAWDVEPTLPWDHRALDKAVSRFYNLSKENK